MLNQSLARRHLTIFYYLNVTVYALDSQDLLWWIFYSTSLFVFLVYYLKKISFTIFALYQIYRIFCRLSDEEIIYMI